MNSPPLICTFGTRSVSPRLPRNVQNDSRSADGAYYRSEMKETWMYATQSTPTEMMQLDQPLPSQNLGSLEPKYPCLQRQRSNDSSMIGISPTHFSQVPAYFGNLDVGPRTKDAKRTRQHRLSIEPQHTSETDYEDVSTSLKKVRLPMPETVSIRVKTLTGRTLHFEYVCHPYVCPC